MLKPGSALLALTACLALLAAACGPSDDEPDPAACAARSEAISACIDAGRGPRSCLAEASSEGGAACDADLDGVPDEFEDALSRSYAPAFAFNKSDGSHTGGDSEPYWPGSVRHFLKSSRLVWREDGKDAKEVLSDPDEQALSEASLEVDGKLRLASDPDRGHGTNFWLCLEKKDGDYPDEAVLPSVKRSRELEGGPDLVTFVRPTNGNPEARYFFVGAMLFFPYNAHSVVDDHEGDWEGGGVFVDTETGEVAAAFFDRHPSADSQRLVPLVGDGAEEAKNPADEDSFGNVCDDGDVNRAKGVRFWDYAGPRHHVVFYVSTGGHSSYDYPGNTKIQGAGCVEQVMVRDTHNGNGEKLLPWRSEYVEDWEGGGADAVLDGVQIRNVGEEAAPRLPWARYHGQWGCQNEKIAKSYPGPWDNERLCRHWVTQRWGDAPPFESPKTGSCDLP